MAATGPFFSLQNTNFVVLIAFIVFVGILVYMKVPAKLTGMLDARAATIKAELDEARALREEAKSILATYERRQKEVQEQADRIVSLCAGRGACRRRPGQGRPQGLHRPPSGFGDRPDRLGRSRSDPPGP
jgi:hypothetical protein